MTRATSSTDCAPGSVRESGPPPMGVLPEFGGHDAREHQHHADLRMGRCELEPQGLGERVQRRLRRAVGRAHRRPRSSGEHRGDVHQHALPPRLEVGHGHLHPVERRARVVPHHRLEVLVGDVEHRGPGDAPPGVVHPDFDPAEPCQGPFEYPLHVGPACDVGGNDLDRSAEGGRHLAEDLFPAGDQHQRRVATGELARQRGPDARARAGDDHHRPAGLLGHIA